MKCETPPKKSNISLFSIFTLIPIDADRFHSASIPQSEETHFSSFLLLLLIASFDFGSAQIFVVSLTLISYAIFSVSFRSRFGLTTYFSCARFASVHLCNSNALKIQHLFDAFVRSSAMQPKSNRNIRYAFFPGFNYYLLPVVYFTVVVIALIDSTLFHVNI